MATSSDIDRTETNRLDELYASVGAAGEFSCPICGIELTRANFDTPERDYSCPFCGTRQPPSVLGGIVRT
jgi:predicted RNA-binding Zn-ribbon protein involved in translation (DUF1610 family)